MRQLIKCDSQMGQAPQLVKWNMLLVGLGRIGELSPKVSCRELQREEGRGEMGKKRRSHSWGKGIEFLIQVGPQY